MRLSAIQYRPPHGQPAQAREELCALTVQALDQGAQLVVLPEMATTGYVFDSADEIRPHSEPAEGPTLAALGPLASAARATVVVGFAEQAADGRLYNSALVVGPDGALQAVYRKVLLFDLDYSWAEPGHERLCLPSPVGRLAPAICMDLNDDGLIRWLWAERPQVVAFCTNWLEEGLDVQSYWRLRLRGWRGWFVAANRWGEERGVRFCGRSAILAPDGRAVAKAPPDGDGVLVVDTDAA